MSKRATEWGLALSLSTVFMLNNGCEDVRIEHNAVAIDATEVQINFYDPVTHEYEQTDIFPVKNAQGCIKKVNEFFSHSSRMRALCYNDKHIVAVILEDENGHHKIALYPEGLLHKGRAPLSP